MELTESTVQLWSPEDKVDRDLIRKELASIVSSTEFRNSKRYPALLTYIVEAALEGDTGKIRERTLGVEVFDRPPDYDTSSDPVVRYNAGQVRKRLASFYHEEGANSDVQIYLPAGSYLPEFRRRIPKVSAVAGERIEPPAPAGGATNPDILVRESRLEVEAARAQGRSFWVVTSTIAALLCIAAGLVSAFRQPSPLDMLWTPFAAGGEQTLLIQRSKTADDKRAFISFETGWATARVSGILNARKKSYTIQLDSETTLANMRERPVVVIGSNAISAQLLEPLRYRLLAYPYASQSSRIVDQQHPQSNQWQVDFQKTPTISSFSDYAIAARFSDARTGAPVLVLAGIGRDGTAAAADCVTSTPCMGQVMTKLGRAALKSNFEIVLRTDVINGQRGVPIIEAAYAW